VNACADDGAKLIRTIIKDAHGRDKPGHIDTHQFTGGLFDDQQNGERHRRAMIFG
jgi:hypothetical protein